MIEDCKLKEKNRFVDDILKQVLIIIPNNEIMLITKFNEFYNSRIKYLKRSLIFIIFIVFLM